MTEEIKATIFLIRASSLPLQYRRDSSTLIKVPQMATNTPAEATAGVSNSLQNKASVS
jgi:hypothetical protein